MEQSVRLTHTFARERIAQLYIPLRELRFLARSAFLCNREFQRNFLLYIKAPALYERIQAVLDYISGMTDVFALDLYRKINGNSLPAV